jgi:hypothetical protein
MDGWVGREEDCGQCNGAGPLAPSSNGAILVRLRSQVQRLQHLDPGSIQNDLVHHTAHIDQQLYLCEHIARYRSDNS